MEFKSFSREAHAAYILLIEEFGEKHGDPRGFEEGQAEWERIKSSPKELDIQLAIMLDEGYERLEEHCCTVAWRREVRKREEEHRKANNIS
ncbi:MAG: hypothetical protein CMJ47_13335 [Planctomyces sp.]|nr:hypothetical protein [Planctomyces sp.]